MSLRKLTFVLQCNNWLRSTNRFGSEILRQPQPGVNRGQALSAIARYSPRRRALGAEKERTCRRKRGQIAPRERKIRDSRIRTGPARKPGRQEFPSRSRQ